MFYLYDNIWTNFRKFKTFKNCTYVNKSRVLTTLSRRKKKVNYYELLITSEPEYLCTKFKKRTWFPSVQSQEETNKQIDERIE